MVSRHFESYLNIAIRSQPSIQILCIVLVVLSIGIFTRDFSFAPQKAPNRTNIVTTNLHGSKGVNYLDGKTYTHHPVMLLASLEPVKFKANFLVEPNSLYVPVRYDCSKLLGLETTKNFYDFFYFSSVPSRWYLCWNYYALRQSGVPFFTPLLPLIDEEYREHVAIWDAAINARKKFVMMELGARWGTWGARAATMLRERNPIPYEIVLVDNIDNHCEGAREVNEVNDLQMKIYCDFATSIYVKKWMSTQEQVNVLDVDIQGNELSLFRDTDVLQEVNEKVMRLIIGTHNVSIHDELRKTFQNWTKHVSYTYQTDEPCMYNLRNRTDELTVKREALDVILTTGCYRNTSFGKVAAWDGELILDNPRFHLKEPLFGNIDIDTH